MSPWVASCCAASPTNDHSQTDSKQMVSILTAVLSDGLPAVEAACQAALKDGLHSADVVLNILARQRDPAPAATIATPAGLQLRDAPIADCGRYDNLRRIADGAF